MKKIQLLLSVCFLAMTLLTTGCLKDSCNREVTYIKPIPVYKTLEEIRVPLSVEAARAFEHPGKIYTFGSYLFVNDYLKGIHVIDNSDPTNPVKLNFLSIPGNVDIAVKDDVLYADNYIDLLAINIENIQQPYVTDRIEHAFPAKSEATDDGLLVAYIGDEVTEKVDCNWNPDPSWRLLSDSNNPSFSGADSDFTTKNAASLNGVAGSMARFAVVAEQLYIIDESTLHLFNVSNASNPNKTTEVTIGQGIETIFPYKNNLFIGANNGMYIYDNSTPSNPTFVSRFEHFTACDPVVVEGSVAYVTLRNDNECGSGWRDELQVIDISDLNAPFLVHAETDLQSPQGLAVNDNMVYVCDGNSGLRVFRNNYEAGSIANVPTLTPVQALGNLRAYDAIAVPNSTLLLVIGSTGLYQYDRSNPNQLVQLSHIGFD